MAASKKKKKLLSLLLLVLLIVALIGIYFLLDKKEKTAGSEELLSKETNSTQDTEASTVPICPLDREAITKLSFENDKFSAAIQKKEDGTYALEGRDDFPLHQNRAGYAFANVTKDADALVSTDADLSVYGLDKPRIKIIATDAGGNTYRLNIGDKLGTASTTGYYACLDGSRDVYRVSTDLVVYFNMEEKDWIELEDLPTIDTTTIVAVEVKSEEFGDLALYHTGAIGDGDGNPNSSNWRMEKPFANVLSTSEASVTELISKYNYFSFGDPVDYRPENFASYGLEDPVTKLTITYETSSDLFEGLIKKKLCLHIGNQSESGDYYVKLDGSNRVYRMTEPNVRALVAPDVNNLYEKRFSLIYIYTVSELEVTFGEVSHKYEMTHEDVTDENGSVTKQSHFVVDGVAVSDESTSFNTFYTYFVKPTASFVLPEDYETDADPILSLHYKRTEKAYGDLDMVYYPYDESFYVVRINGQMMYAVDKRDIDSMMEGINAYVPD